MASRIVGGELKLAMVVGGEALKTAQLARRENLSLNWQESDSRPFEDRGIGESLATAHEFAHGLGVPIQTYPLFSALRAQAGHSLDAHLRAMAEMMKPFNAVAAENPFVMQHPAQSASLPRQKRIDSSVCLTPSGLTPWTASIRARRLF